MRSYYLMVKYGGLLYFLASSTVHRTGTAHLDFNFCTRIALLLMLFSTLAVARLRPPLAGRRRRGGEVPSRGRTLRKQQKYVMFGSG